MAHFVTFFSWKGGVGRTLALANVAVQLARRGRKVLIVDWDLEAPGLDRFFLGEPTEGREQLKVEPAANGSGLLGLLTSVNSDTKLQPADWESRLTRIEVPAAPATYSNSQPPRPGALHLLASGYATNDYSERLGEFSWERFYGDQAGDLWLETLRSQWDEAYDWVLIDSRTGLTDAGSVCTVHFPDYLVLVFTANDQSLAGGLKVVAAAQEARRNFPRDRAPLQVLPLLSRWDGDKEIDLAERWLIRMDRELRVLTNSWLPADFSPRQFLEKSRVPHVAKFSFGEPLPVLTHSLTDPALPGAAFDSLARLLDSQLNEAGRLVDGDYSSPDPSLSRHETFDVFLCYSGRDKEHVRQLNHLLTNRGVKTWFYEQVGFTQGLLGLQENVEQIKKCRWILVCTGEEGLTSWQLIEATFFVANDIAKQGTIPLIHVLLPASPKNVVLPASFQGALRVDLSAGFDNGRIDQIVQQVFGKPPPSTAPKLK